MDQQAVIQGLRVAHPQAGGQCLPGGADMTGGKPADRLVVLEQIDEAEVREEGQGQAGDPPEGVGGVAQRREVRARLGQELADSLVAPAFGDVDEHAHAALEAAFLVAEGIGRDQQMDQSSVVEDQVAFLVADGNPQCRALLEGEFADSQLAAVAADPPVERSPVLPQSRRRSRPAARRAAP